MQPVDLGIPGLTDAHLLGRGGFGTVYSATEPEFGRSVAVKILRERFDDEAVRRAFARECQAMGALSGHPHIVTVHRGGATVAGAPYIVMDLMSGGSLAERVKAGPLPWAEVLETGILLASALETAHRRGILHLDLKPANVLVSRYGEPKLADFGISRLPGVAETSDAVRASPAFAAPERLADGTATVSTDLYGLGATLFTLLTGTPAFQGESADLIVVLARIVRQPLPDLRGDGVPDAVCRVLERLMAKSPGERHATAADVVAALQDAQRATGRPLTRAVIEGAPTPTEEAGAPTSLGLGAVAPTVSSGTRPDPARTDPGSARREAARPGHPMAAASPTAFPSTGPPRAESWPPPDPPPRNGSWTPPDRPTWPASGPPSTAAPHPVPVDHTPHHPLGAWPDRPPTLASPAPWPSPGPARPAGAPAWRRGLLWGVLAAVVVAAATVVGVVVLGGALDPSGPIDPTSAAPTAETPTAGAPAGAVAVAPEVTNPETENARVLLDAYVTAINEERYADAFALFSPDSPTASGGLDSWLAVQQPRVISDARIVSVRDDGPDGLITVWTFRSRQDPSFSPDGLQDCLDWELSYTLAGPAPDWLIRASSAVTGPRPC